MKIFSRNEEKCRPHELMFNTDAAQMQNRINYRIYHTIKFMKADVHFNQI